MSTDKECVALAVYDPDAASSRVPPPVVTGAVANPKPMERNNESTPIMVDTKPPWIPFEDMESLKTNPVQLLAADTNVMETNVVDYYDSFFYLHYTGIEYDGNFKEDYEVIDEDEFDIEYGFGVPNNTSNNTNSNGVKITFQMKLGAWTSILD
ncbi:hypothetical protein L1887_11336 [Cichorium endivia]|nr:hypothetical protein L1887_11336 [Cichorium endivia]